MKAIVRTRILDGLYAVIRGDGTEYEILVEWEYPDSIHETDNVVRKSAKDALAKHHEYVAHYSAP